MSHLTNCCPIVSFSVTRQLDKRQVRKGGELLQSFEFEGLDDDGYLVLAVRDCTKRVLRKNSEEDLCQIVPSVSELLIIVFDFDVETSFAFSIHRARSILIQLLNFFYHLLESHHRVQIVLELGSILVALPSLECLQLGQREVVYHRQRLLLELLQSLDLVFVVLSLSDGQE